MIKMVSYNICQNIIYVQDFLWVLHVIGHVKPYSI